MKLQKRDWLTGLLILAIVATNWAWYQNAETQDTSHKSHVIYDVNLQFQVNKLKACVDNNIRPCDISPSKQ